MYYFRTKTQTKLILSLYNKITVYLLHNFKFRFWPASLWFMWGSLSFGGNGDLKWKFFVQKFFHKAYDMVFYMDQVLIPTLEYVV